MFVIMNPAQKFRLLKILTDFSVIIDVWLSDVQISFACCPWKLAARDVPESIVQ